MGFQKIRDERMKIAAGTPVERGRNTANLDPETYLRKLMSENFSGYVCVASHGETGLEEGVLIFDKSQIVSSDYEYYRYNKNFSGNEGLKRTLNALRAKKGVVDVFSLSAYQVQLILTLNEECNLTEIVSADSLEIPPTFNNSYEQQLKQTVRSHIEPETDRDALLKRYGLTALTSPTSSRTQLIRAAKKEQKSLNKIMEEEE